MNLGWEIEEGLWAGQADFGGIVMLDSRGFVGVVLREFIVVSTLCAFEIVILVVFGIFAREESINLFTRNGKLAFAQSVWRLSSTDRWALSGTARSGTRPAALPVSNASRKLPKTPVVSLRAGAMTCQCWTMRKALDRWTVQDYGFGETIIFTTSGPFVSVNVSTTYGPTSISLIYALIREVWSFQPIRSVHH